jgi:hypothetical protein
VAKETGQVERMTEKQKRFRFIGSRTVRESRGAAAPGARDAIRSVSRVERRALPSRVHAVRLVDRWTRASRACASALESRASASTVPRPKDRHPRTTRCARKTRRAWRVPLAEFFARELGVLLRLGGRGGLGHRGLRGFFHRRGDCFHRLGRGFRDGRRFRRGGFLLLGVFPAHRRVAASRPVSDGFIFHSPPDAGC